MDKKILFESIQKKCKVKLIEMHFLSRVGHIGGNLSCLDSLITLFHFIKKESDSFILSKGHSAGALYIVLWSLGLLNDEDLITFHKDNTRLAGHPSANWHKEIQFSTGSLGHGASLANGVALANKIKNLQRKTYCLLSDGELNEGSTWEALMFLSHHQLNVHIIVDKNGMQGFGQTHDVLNLGELTDKFRSFNILSDTVDGHDFNSLYSSLADTRYGPKITIANTIKGKGVSFMENKMEWHYLPLSDELFKLAIQELS